MTDAKPVPSEIMIVCRDSCAAWLARSLGLESFSNPATAAIGLVLGGGLSRKQAEVARMIIWIDRALPLDRLLKEHEGGTPDRMYIQPGKDTNWYEVDVPPPSDADIAVHGEVAGFESNLNATLRKIANHLESVEGLFVCFCEAGMRMDEAITQRVRRGRVVRTVPGPRSKPETVEERAAAEQAVRSWTNQYSRWDALMAKYAAAHAELGVFRELVQLRRPFDAEATHLSQS